MELQVRVAVNVFPQRALVVVERIARVTLAPSARSNATGSSNVHAVPHSTTRDGTQVSVGGVVSATVTVWLHVLLFPHASLACHVLVAVKWWPQSALVVVERIAR